MSPITATSINAFSLKEWLNQRISRVFNTPEGAFYYAQDIGDMLGMKRVSSMISKVNSDYTEKDIVTPEQRRQYNIVTYKKHRGEMRANSTVLLLTEWGARKLIVNSRAPTAEQVRRELNCEPGYYHRAIPELQFVNNICSMFVGEEFITQYPILSYRIDLYMPKYNLAIEFDEQGHKYRTEADIIRQDAIEHRLGCTFIRVKDTDDQFAAAGRIYAYIHANTVLAI
jgi:very-short-patch-repair endonuclease